jgi:hypothetical protein
VMTVIGMTRRPSLSLAGVITIAGGALVYRLRLRSKAVATRTV